MNTTRVSVITWVTAVCAVLATVLSLRSLAGTTEASSELAKILGNTNSLQGLFQQRQYDGKDKLLSESNGRFGLLRPGYFFWHIDAPDNQSIVATPEYLWHHDLDLETVTRRPITDSSEMSPLQILGADMNALATRFIVEKIGAANYSLTPLDQSAAFNRLELILDDHHISQLQIVDKQLQRIQIQFSDVSDTPTLSLENFDFTPPAGVDLFYYDE